MSCLFLLITRLNFVCMNAISSQTHSREWDIFMNHPICHNQTLVHQGAVRMSGTHHPWPGNPLTLPAFAPDFDWIKLKKRRTKEFLCPWIDVQKHFSPRNPVLSALISPVPSCPPAVLGGLKQHIVPSGGICMSPSVQPGMSPVTVGHHIQDGKYEITSLNAQYLSVFLLM